MSGNATEYSIAYWCSQSSKHRCGYCKNPEGSTSHGMWVKTMSTRDYQNLIDRGWRRSGNYIYKPIMKEICCPQYTIKCDAINFQPSKSQKKVIKKMNKFINDGEMKIDTSPPTTGTTTTTNPELLSENISESFMMKKEPPKIFDRTDDIAQLICDDKDDAVVNTNSCDDIETKDVVDGGSCSKDDKKIENITKKGIGADPSKPLQKKAKLLRLERKQEKMLKRGMSLEKLPQNNQGKTLEEFFGEITKNPKHELKLELINTSQRNENWERVKDIEYDLYQKYQTIIHNDPPEKCTMDGFCRFLVQSPLKITLEQIDENHESFDLVANLYAKYQMAVHNDTPDECDKEQFVDFLVDSPLKFRKFPGNSNLGFGSFHQLYWLDKKLIAVGVIDILPKCVSAVYFFYDPDYRNLTLGTYGALREVEFVRKLNKLVPSIEYYYMGFYIHSCPKMRYKGRLSPSYLLCPESYCWVEIEKCIPKLEQSKYCRLNDDLEAVDEDACRRQDVDRIKIFLNGIMPFHRFKHKYGADQETFDLIGKLIGKKLLDTLVFIH